MFGYVTVNQQELKLKDFDLYRSYYCGLCHTLKKCYGRRGQLLLNYDMTFLALLLSGLYEPEQMAKKARCVVHPLRRHGEVMNEAIEYAADMTILLAYEKAKDDWADERSASANVMAHMLEKKVSMLKKRWPRQAEKLHTCVQQLAMEEKAGCDDPDRVAGLTGEFLAEIFVWKEDEWQNDLRRIGFFLGKFIYLMDAWDDLEKDRKKQNYNIFLRMQEKAPVDTPYAMEIMNDCMAHASAAFERLPILENVDILRNILYSGVWMKAAARIRTQQMKADKVRKKSMK